MLKQSDEKKLNFVKKNKKIYHSFTWMCFFKLLLNKWLIWKTSINKFHWCKWWQLDFNQILNTKKILHLSNTLLLQVGSSILASVTSFSIIFSLNFFFLIIFRISRIWHWTNKNQLPEWCIQYSEQSIIVSYYLYSPHPVNVWPRSNQSHSALNINSTTVCY